MFGKGIDFTALALQKLEPQLTVWQPSFFCPSFLDLRKDNVPRNTSHRAQSWLHIYVFSPSIQTPTKPPKFIQIALLMTSNLRFSCGSPGVMIAG